MKNKKKALLQAQVNQNFASLSYILMPEKKIINHNSKSDICPDIGLITFDGKKAELKKKAKRLQLPGSYFSWILNEHIGRKIYGKSAQ